MIGRLIAWLKRLFKRESRTPLVPLTSLPTKPREEWSGSRVYVPKPGFEHNPLKPHRNLACPCKSGRKIKACHGIQEFVTAADAKIMRGYLRDLAAVGLIEARISEISA